MTFLGKILVVVQLVLSLLFVGFAAAVYNYHVNWRGKQIETQKELTTAQGTIRNIQAELDKLTTETAASIQNITNQNAELQASVTGLEQERNLLTQDLQNVRTERDSLLAEAQIAVDEAEHRRLETAEQRDVNQKLYSRVDELIAYVRQLEDQVFTQDVSAKSLRAKHQRVVEELAKLSEQYRRERAGGADSELAGQPLPPKVEGEIQNVRLGSGTTPTIVQLNLGSDDGLSEGNRMYVYTTNGEPKYLGRIKLTLVKPDRAVGEVIETDKNGIIKVGDTVATTISRR